MLLEYVEKVVGLIKRKKMEVKVSEMIVCYIYVSN